MKKIYTLCLLAGISVTASLHAQLNYTMTADNPGYTALSGGNSIGDLSAGSDLSLTAALPIGFNFVFDDSTYTEFQMSDNGYIHLGNDLSPTGYGSACCDAVIPNDFSDSSGSNPDTNMMRPFIAPLWEELAIANIGGNCSYLTSGTSPNRILTIEWNKVSWRAPTGTDQISFQIILHETTNVIEFVYLQGAVALGPLPTASIGLAGRTSGDYYSLSDSGTNPTASKTVNTTTISTKPATGQRYLWTPGSPAGIKQVTAKNNLHIMYQQEQNAIAVDGDFSQAGNYTLRITDITGRTIAAQTIALSKGQNKFNVSLPVCAAGVYVADLSGNGTVARSKFTKE